MAARLTALAVQIEAIGVDKVKRALREVEGEAQRAGRGIAGATSTAGPTKFAASARTMAAGLGQVAASGEIAGAGMKQIVIQGSQMALLFGVGGPIVGGIGLVALGIFNMFQRTRKEISDTARTARAELRSLSLSSGSDLLVELYSGDFTADPGSPAALGIGGSKARLAAVQRSIAAAGTTSATDVMTGQTTTASAASAALLQEEKKLIAFLDQTEGRYNRIRVRVNELAAAEVERTGIAAREDVRAKASARAMRDVEKAREAEARLATDIALAFSNAEYQLRGLNIAEDINLSIVRKANAERERQRREFDRQRRDAYLNPDQGTGPFVLPAGGLQADKTEQWLAVVDQQFAHMGQEIGLTFADGISNGLHEAFSGGGIIGGFKALGKTVLAGLGSIFTQMGQSLLQYGLVMKGLLPALSNPFTSGFAAIAAGVALMALGGLLGGITQGRGGAGGTGSFREPYSYARSGDLVQIKLVGTQKSAASDIVPSYNMFNVTLIGENDPAAAAALRRMVNTDKRRG